LVIGTGTTKRLAWRCRLDGSGKGIGISGEHYQLAVSKACSFPVYRFKIVEWLMMGGSGADA